MVVNPIRILIVEDNEPLQKYFSTIVKLELKDQAVEIDQAYNLLEAVEFLTKSNYQKVLLDLNLPPNSYGINTFKQVIKYCDPRTILVLTAANLSLEEQDFIRKNGAKFSFKIDIYNKSFLNFQENQIKKEIIEVLIIEDNDADVNLLRIYLEEYEKPINIHCVNNLNQALSYLLPPCPDIVFVDLGLPGCEGLESLKAVLIACPETSTIVVSGHNQLEIAVETLKIGATDYLCKDTLNAQVVTIALERAIEHKKRMLKIEEMIEQKAKIHSEGSKLEEAINILKSKQRGSQWTG